MPFFASVGMLIWIATIVFAFVLSHKLCSKGSDAFIAWCFTLLGVTFWAFYMYLNR